MSDIRLIQLSNYVRPNPVENKAKNWVLNGKGNYFYQYIIDRSNGSPTNGSIINSYCDLIYGQGLSAKNARTNLEDWTKLKTILKPKELKKIITDYELFGEASFQVVKTKGKDISSINHIPKNLVVPSVVNEEGDIDAYWYSTDWSNTNRTPPEPFSAFGTSNDAIEIYCISPYKAGKMYFPDPDYISGLQYAEMEEEIANLNINSIRSGLSAGYIINVPDGNSLTDEEKNEFERKIINKLTGSNNASNFVLSFNGRDVEVDIVPFPTNDNVHLQWETLNDTAAQKILTAHRCTTPAIVGIISSSGFSNTAEEMDMGEKQLYKRVIQPKQNDILSALEEVLEFYNINLDLYFRPLTEEKEVQLCNHVEMSSDDDELFLTLEKYALDPPEGYDFIENAEIDLSDIELSAIQKSEQDTKIWKIRYAYVGGTRKTPKGGSRPFCLKMRALEMAGKVFRKEDIEQMSADGVNGQFAHSGGKYDIFKFGGGVNCYHRWERRIFKKRLQPDGDPYIGNALQNTDEVNVNEARRQGAKIPKNHPDVAIAEIDKPNKGRY